MARQLTIVRELTVTATTGLVAPITDPSRHPLFWAADGARRGSPPPAVVRFAWLPATGELRVGLQVRHALQVHGQPAPFDAWLRGFSFQRDRCLALRTYFWPHGPYDDYAVAAARLNRRVAQSFVRAIRPHLLPGTLVFDSVDNRFLADRFGHLGRDW